MTLDIIRRVPWFRVDTPINSVPTEEGDGPLNKLDVTVKTNDNIRMTDCVTEHILSVSLCIENLLISINVYLITFYQ